MYIPSPLTHALQLVLTIFRRVHHSHLKYYRIVQWYNLFEILISQNRRTLFKVVANLIDDSSALQSVSNIMRYIPVSDIENDSPISSSWWNEQHNVSFSLGAETENDLAEINHLWFLQSEENGT